MEEIYSGAWFMRKEGILGEYKGSSSRIWEENECRSEITREVEYGRSVKHVYTRR